MKKISGLLWVLLLSVSCGKSVIKEKPADIETPQGMVWIPGGKFMQGANDKDTLALEHEKPAHEVEVDGFFMDATEVTNAQFKKFADATGYITVAEKPVDWEVMKKSLPPGTPKPANSILGPGSMVFNKNVKSITSLANYQEWWTWKPGTNWKHPEGKNSDLKGKDNYPVVHIAYEDALAYCKWTKRRLPTEAEWELAARGKSQKDNYSWGNNKGEMCKLSNTWQGRFPVKNDPQDGFAYIAPVKSYKPNSLGLYDMAGNVWEFTQDWYNTDYYGSLKEGEVVKNPQGAKDAYNPNNMLQSEKIIKGGSFLCNDSYCASYRISARMGMTVDSGSEHVGFRTVADIAMLKKK